MVIKVSDEGGGIRRSNMNRIWSYLYTTADPAILERMIGGNTDDVKDFGTEVKDVFSALFYTRRSVLF